MSDARDIPPARVMNMQCVSHPGDHNCGPHVQVFIICEDSTVWVQYHSSPNNNVPSDGKWYPVVDMVEK